MTAKRHQDAQGSNENYTVALHATTLFVHIWKQRMYPNLDMRCFMYSRIYLSGKAKNYDL